MQSAIDVGEIAMLFAKFDGSTAEEWSDSRDDPRHPASIAADDDEEKGNGGNEVCPEVVSLD